MPRIKRERVLVAMSPKKSLRDSTGRAGGSGKKRVLVAMSGGIDSSVAAAILKKQGLKVIGLHLLLLKDGKKERQVHPHTKGLSISPASRHNENFGVGIKKIAKAIGIPLIVKDVRKEFRKKVVDYFLREYKAGITPNPCVVCNQCVKFKFLFDELLGLGADYVATGHYARIKESKVKSQKSKVAYKLFTAQDKTKDQSYFLYTLAQKQLPKILFPLGNYTKDKVRKIARDLKLPVSVKEESQNICFIEEKYPEIFLRKHLKLTAGNIIDTDGNIVGQHIGLPLYTIGQRRNIRIGGTGPYYVVGKDRKNNQLVVTGNAKDPALYRKEIFIGKANWISGKPKLPCKSLVQTRYRNPKVPAIIKLSAGGLKIEFIKPQRAIAPGQSAVFYEKNGEVIGGGVIK